MRVTNMRSPRTGNKVANQFIITDGDKEVFQSYNTVVAVRDYSDGATMPHITLDINALDYSVTTSKYLYQFLNGRTRKEVLARIASGHYGVADLNKR